MSGALTLVALASFGTIILCAAGFLFGFAKSDTIQDAIQVKKLVQIFEPDAEPDVVFISRKRDAALTMGANGLGFFVRTLGDGMVVRHIAPKNIAQLENGVVRISFDDVGFPDFNFESDDASLSYALAAISGGITP